MDVTTDGSTWLVSCKDGDVHESTDGADTWTKILSGLTIDNSERDLNAVACDGSSTEVSNASRCIAAGEGLDT